MCGFRFHLSFVIFIFIFRAKVRFIKTTNSTPTIFGSSLPKQCNPLPTYLPTPPPPAPLQVASILRYERTDKALTVSIVSRRDFFGFSWESVKICLTVGNQAIIAS